MLAYSVAVILWGAYVRATGSGAGCGSHWPLCNGEVIPRAPMVTTIIEFTHRVTSGLSWLFAVALAWLARSVFPPRDPARRAAAAVLVLMTTEALIGAGLVLFKMVALNESLARGVWVAAHLTNTFLLLAAEALTCYFAAGGGALAPRRHGATTFALAVGFLGLFLVGISGAIVALGDTLFPAASLAEGLAQDLDVGAHLWVRLRALHPLLAVGVTGWLVAAAGAVRFSRKERPIRRAAALLLGTALLQVGIGFANFLLLAPVWLQMVHLAFADATFLAFVFFAARLLSAPETAELIRPELRSTEA
ncbi:MAG: COX15/CtaA family protein [Myxococcales bacterium]|nr:COX15/CtaA family protein [Myxococcales bacterium]